MLLKEITRGQNDTVAKGPGIALGRGHFLGSLKEAGSEMQRCPRDKQWFESADRIRLTRGGLARLGGAGIENKAGAAMAQQ